MKNYRITFGPDDQAPPVSAKALFALSDQESELSCGLFATTIHEPGDAADKFEKLVGFKRLNLTAYTRGPVRDLLREFFYVDGAIKLNAQDLQDLEDATVVFSSDGKRIEGDVADKHSLTFMTSLVENFAYINGSHVIFRGPKYYFLLDGLTFKAGGRTSSINDYEVENVEADLFIPAIARHFNSINQHLKTFSTMFTGQLCLDILQNKKEFCRDVANRLRPAELRRLKRKVEKGNLKTGDAAVDQFYVTQYISVLDELKEFREFVENFEKAGSSHALMHVIDFLSMRSELIRHAKVVFGIDIDAIFNRYAKTFPSRGIRKVILGLLDAKINMLAFAQNAGQIMYSESFMNPDFPGSLVFSQEQVRQIRNMFPDGFTRLKATQASMRAREANISLLTTLDEHIAFYLDILLESNPTAYVKLVGQIPDDLPEVTAGEFAGHPDEFEDVLTLLREFFGLIDGFVARSEQKEDEKARRKEKKGRPYKPTDQHYRIRNTGLKKIVRLYREENDPLVMIKCAQNALNTLIRKGFNPAKDVLHVMSVNYGGALIGLHARHVFPNTVNKGQVLSNPGGVVYSIYDVKNANDFSNLTDYPFARLMKNGAISEGVRKKLEAENWLLVFDDNTNSGETLDNIRMLAEKTEFYGRIDLFPCRVSANAANYRKSLDPAQKLAMLANAALLSRKAKVNREGTRYKELLGTIVGNRLYKIRNAAHQ